MFPIDKVLISFQMALGTSPDFIIRLTEPVVYAAHDHSFIIVSLLAMVPTMLIFRTWFRAIALALQLFAILGGV